MSHTLRRHGATLDILLQSHAPCSTCHHLVRSSCALDELCFVETQSVVIVGVQPCVSDKLEARVELDRRSLEKAASILEIELGTQAHRASFDIMFVL